MEKDALGMRHIGKRSILAGIFTFMLALWLLFAYGFSSRADEPLNPEEVEIYCASEKSVSALGEIPEDKLLSFQISTEGLSGTPGFQVISGHTYVRVSSAGLVEPNKTVWYWKGNQGWSVPVDGYDRITTEYYPGTAVVRVTCGDYTQDIQVTVVEIGDSYVNQKVQEVYDSCVEGTTTDLEKYTAFTKWIGNNTIYDYRYQSWQDMLLFEKGDCWASTNLIIKLSQMAGIDARVNYTYQSTGYNPGHRNAIAKIDGKYYIGEAGYGTYTKPRGASVYELPGGWNTKKINEEELAFVGYSGFDEELIVPENWDGKRVTQFGDGETNMMYNGSAVSIILPKTVTAIHKYAFYSSKKLKSVYIPASVTSFYPETWIAGCITDVYYEGSEAMWKAIEGVDSLDLGSDVKIHYNRVHASNENYLPFNDVKHYSSSGSETWYFASVRFAYMNGLVSGYDDADADGLVSFKPNSTIKRGEFMVILYRMAGSPDVDLSDNPFSDVGDKFDTKAILWAYRNGIVSGMGDGSFGRKSELTRAQAARILKNYAEYMQQDTSQTADLSAFLDHSSLREGQADPHWALSYMKWAVGAGIISGMEEKDGAGNVVGYKLSQGGKTTRAQICRMLMAFMELYP